jgi:hypothetical protein
MEQMEEQKNNGEEIQKNNGEEIQKKKKKKKKKRRRRRKSSCSAGRCLHTFLPVECSQPMFILIQLQKEKRHLLVDKRLCLSVSVMHAEP